VVAAVNEVEIEKEEELASKHLPRNCKVTKWPDFQGYGFNLHAERDRVGQFIGLIDDDSPADAASLREGDRIIEVDGANIENETHQQVIQRIKAGGNQTTLLVLDREGDDYYKSKGMTISSELYIVRQCSNPPRGKMSIMCTCFIHTYSTVRDTA
jgi:C-terminal processing protease CtpA/Prc